MTLREYLTKRGYTPFHGSKSINYDWEYVADENSLKRGFKGAIKKRNGSMYDLSVTYTKSKHSYRVIIG